MNHIRLKRALLLCSAIQFVGSVFYLSFYRSQGLYPLRIVILIGSPVAYLALGLFCTRFPVASAFAGFAVALAAAACVDPGPFGMAHFLEDGRLIMQLVPLPGAWAAPSVINTIMVQRNMAPIDERAFWRVLAAGVLAVICIGAIVYSYWSLDPLPLGGHEDPITHWQQEAAVDRWLLLLAVAASIALVESIRWLGRSVPRYRRR